MLQSQNHHWGSLSERKERAADVAQLVGCLPGIYRAWSLICIKPGPCLESQHLGKLNSMLKDSLGCKKRGKDKKRERKEKMGSKPGKWVPGVQTWAVGLLAMSLRATCLSRVTAALECFLVMPFYLVAAHGSLGFCKFTS